MMTPEQTKQLEKEGLYFAAGNDEFRAARKACSERMDVYNSIANHASPEDRARAWLELCPQGKINIPKDEDGNPILATAEAAFTNPDVVPAAPFVKAPIIMDYGLRVHIAPSTFINRGCTILDTPVADIRVGENCNFGPNVSLYSVSHPLCPGSDGKLQSSGKPITIGDWVWVGGQSTIMGGVTIGSGAVIAAGSIVTKDVDPEVVVGGSPARFIKKITEADKWDRPVAAETIEEAMKLSAS